MKKQQLMTPVERLRILEKLMARYPKWKALKTMPDAQLFAIFKRMKEQDARIEADIIAARKSPYHQITMEEVPYHESQG